MLRLEVLMLKNAKLVMFVPKEPFKVEEEPIELTVEFLHTFLPTVTLNSMLWRNLVQLQEPTNSKLD